MLRASGPVLRAETAAVAVPTNRDTPTAALPGGQNREAPGNLRPRPRRPRPSRGAADNRPRRPVPGSFASPALGRCLAATDHVVVVEQRVRQVVQLASLI